MADSNIKPAFSTLEQWLWSRLEVQITEWPGADPGQLLRNLELFSTPGSLKRTLWFDFLYRQIALKVPGVIHTYGLRWGRDMVLWHNLKTIHEGDAATYRDIYGFDTFTGHVGSNPTLDGDDPLVQDGSFAVPEGYMGWLGPHLQTYTDANPTGRLVLMAGDVRDTVEVALRDHAHAPVALAYLDLDLAEPTAHVLGEVWPDMAPGAIVAFDEFGSSKYPGEGRAALEVLGGVRFQQCPFGEWVYAVRT